MSQPGIFEPLPNYFPACCNNTIGVAFQMPQCNISSNPYGGTTGLFGLLNCIAIQNTGITAIIRFYLPPGGAGPLIGFDTVAYPSTPSSGWDPWVYVGTDGDLYFSEWAGGTVLMNLPISPGWHTVVVSEYYSDGQYHMLMYLDSPSNYVSYVTSALPQMFGLGQYPYSYVGVEYSGDLPATTGSWFFYDGVIDYVALYPGGPSVGTKLINNGVFNIASQQETPTGYAVDYPPNGVEPVVAGVYASTPMGLSILLPSQLGIINYAIHVAHPTTPLGTSALVTP